MRVIRKRRRLALFLAIAAVVALTAAGAAYALTAFSFKYATQKRATSASVTWLSPRTRTSLSGVNR
jgi:hypothetical protein